MTTPAREHPTDPTGVADPLPNLNALAEAPARAAFHECAGSRRWAATMSAGRPYAGLDALLAGAESAFDGLDDGDWREAFAAHSPIGAPAAGDARGAGEQSGMAAADPAQRAAIAAGNARYRERFGYGFLIRAAGRSAAEMLAALQERLAHDPATELALAAREQREITRRRLIDTFGA